jgi:DNA-binding transcriptional regulator YhcF (GntR family)
MKLTAAQVHMARLSHSKRQLAAQQRKAALHVLRTVPTLTQIASALDVDVTTIERAVKGLTHKRVQFPHSSENNR